MCGIFGYVGHENAQLNVLEGLRRLEYRGYDSWGVASIEGENISITKHTGAIGNVDQGANVAESHVAIGHTRWATHGGVTDANAHPHFSTDHSFALAQNGIVENYQELKAVLIEKGYPFYSETDTEVIVRLVEEKLKGFENRDLKEALRLAFLDLKGRNTVILVDKQTNEINAIRNGSPLVVGVSEMEVFIASDTLSFADKTNKVIYVEDYQLINVKGTAVELFDARTNEKVETKVEEIDFEASKIDKEGFDHFMLKEIVEQKHTVLEATQYSQEELEEFVAAIKNARRVYTVGAGTAGYAATQIAYYLRTIAQIDAMDIKAYEFSSYKHLFTKDDLILAISQSGETADTLEVVEAAKATGMPVASLVNMVGSTLTRMSDFAFLSRSGPEVCVASTKAFTSQISWGYLVANTLVGKYADAKMEIANTAEYITSYLNEVNLDTVKRLAALLKEKEHFFILGKGQNYSIALEGALKIKEITYKHFEGFTAGELKHGVIALIEDGTPVFGIVSEDEHKADMMSALEEVKSRGAYVVGVGKDDNHAYDFLLPVGDLGGMSPVASVIPFQLLSYFMGVELGCNPDKPRNLAKSVTVK